MDAEALVYVSAGARTRLRSGVDRRRHMGEGRTLKGPWAMASGRAATRDENECLEIAVVITDLAKKRDR
jgi:hypothetical protein